MKSENTGASQTRRYAWFVLFMLVLLYFVNYADRTLANALLEKIKESYQVSDTYMGFVIGPAFAFVYCAAAIPIARLADRYNRVRIIAIGAVIWSLFTMLSGLSKTPEMFAFSRFGVGIGEAAFLAPAGTALAASYDWQTTFLWLGGPGIILAALTVVFVNEPERGRLDGDNINTNNQLNFSQVYRNLMAARAFKYLTLAAFFGGFSVGQLQCLNGFLIFPTNLRERDMALRL